MRLESNIFFSAAAHLLFIAAALFLAGRNAVSLFPGQHIEVTLVSQATPEFSGGRRASSKTHRASGIGKPAPSHLHHKAVKAISPQHRRAVIRPARIAVPSPVSRAEVPKATPPEAGQSSKKRKEELFPTAGRRNYLSGGERFTIDISHYSAEELSGGIVRTGGPSDSTTPGSSPSNKGDKGGLQGEGRPGERGRNGAISAIREAIEKAKSYPPFARRSGMEGTVTAEFSINGRGRPEEVRITSSSGFAILDSAAKETIIRAAPFPVVQGKIEIPISYRLRRE